MKNKLDVWDEGWYSRIKIGDWVLLTTKELVYSIRLWRELICFKQRSNAFIECWVTVPFFFRPTRWTTIPSGLTSTTKSRSPWPPTTVRGWATTTSSSPPSSTSAPQSKDGIYSTKVWIVNATTVLWFVTWIRIIRSCNSCNLQFVFTRSIFSVEWT